MDEFMYKVKLKQIQKLETVEELVNEFNKLRLEFSPSSGYTLFSDFVPNLSERLTFNKALNNLLSHALILEVLNSLKLKGAKDFKTLLALTHPIIALDVSKTLELLKDFYGQV